MDNPPSPQDPDPPERVTSRGERWRVAISRGAVRGRVPRAVLMEAAARVCRRERVCGTIQIIVIGDAEMRRLNRQYLRKDRPTDVLSFPIDGSAPRQPVETLVGEVYCNLDHARRWAKQTGDSQSAEMARLVVHGILHLLGYDHHSTKERHEMTRRENRYLAAAGLISTRTDDEVMHGR